ncbi:LysR substrate-binding domain-containing protein [Photobacterium atrarenae]|uniref:LysR substrate-binding domain-containing protein n=1 Tax=Photobacterium atrarenae TaxID=865757 RepID=A0ABY5GNC4_9GAMM|nr:LysR substrate-binding domain-containing protein [Photobacterium atrarenae]UTV30832.1 LysR substrate-binding domain-containing protein [Photobacterium atrarenae]
MDKLKSMQVFVDVVQRGSLAKSAAHFAITATMVGKHIKTLESTLGAKLLNRTTRRQSLTEAGAMYYRECLRILDDIQEAEDNLQAFTNTPMGTLRINAPVTYGALVVAPIVAQFLQQFPQMNIALNLDNQRIDPLHDPFDVVIRIGHLDDSSLIARQIGDYQMLFCASPTYFRRHGMPRDISELRQHDCLGFDYGDLPFHVTSQEAFVQNRHRLRLRSNSGQALKAAALAHAGIILQPSVLLQQELERGQLVECLLSDRPEARPIHLIYKDKSQSLKIRTFIDFFMSQV